MAGIKCGWIRAQAEITVQPQVLHHVNDRIFDNHLMLPGPIWTMIIHMNNFQVTLPPFTWAGIEGKPG